MSLELVEEQTLIPERFDPRSLYSMIIVLKAKKDIAKMSIKIEPYFLDIKFADPGKVIRNVILLNQLRAGETISLLIKGKIKEDVKEGFLMKLFAKIDQESPFVLCEKLILRQDVNVKAHIEEVKKRLNIVDLLLVVETPVILKPPIRISYRATGKVVIEPIDNHVKVYENEIVVQRPLRSNVENKILLRAILYSPEVYLLMEIRAYEGHVVIPLEHKITCECIEGLAPIADVRDLKESVIGLMDTLYITTNNQQEEIANEVVRDIINGYNVIIRGEPGIGKTKTLIPIVEKLLKRGENIIVVRKFDRRNAIEKMNKLPDAVKIIDDLEENEITEDLLRGEKMVITMRDYGYQKARRRLENIPKLKVYEMRREKIPIEFLIDLLLRRLQDAHLLIPIETATGLIKKAEKLPLYVVAMVNDLLRERPKNWKKYLEKVPRSFKSLVARTILRTAREAIEILTLATIAKWLKAEKNPLTTCTLIHEEHIKKILKCWSRKIGSSLKTANSTKLIIKTWLRKAYGHAYVPKHSLYQRALYEILVRRKLDDIDDRYRDELEEIFERIDYQLGLEEKADYIREIERIGWKAFGEAVKDMRNKPRIQIGILKTYTRTSKITEKPEYVLEIREDNIEILREKVIGILNITALFSRNNKPEIAERYLNELERMIKDINDINIIRHYAKCLANIIIGFVKKDKKEKAQKHISKLSEIAEKTSDEEIEKVLEKAKKAFLAKALSHITTLTRSL